MLGTSNTVTQLHNIQEGESSGATARPSITTRGIMKIFINIIIKYCRRFETSYQNFTTSLKR